MAFITIPQRLMVSASNPAPERGQILSFPWFAIHDGSFDAFDVGDVASAGIEAVAEDGSPGDPQNQFTPEFVAALIDRGADLSKSPPPEATLNPTMTWLSSQSRACMKALAKATSSKDL